MVEGDVRGLPREVSYLSGLPKGTLSNGYSAEMAESMQEEQISRLEHRTWGGRLIDPKGDEG